MSIISYGDARMPEAFWDRVVPAPTGCWAWVGPQTNGYGQYSASRTSKLAHRSVYLALVGPIPEGMTVDHLCHGWDLESCQGLGTSCPHRKCVNPHHFDLKTIGDNTLAGNSPSARHARKTHCVHGHPFTPENTRVYRTQWGMGRACITCARARWGPETPTE